MVISYMRQHRWTLYPPSEAPLKDPVNNYSSYTGVNKWLLASLMPIVFRCVLQDVHAMLSGAPRADVKLIRILGFSFAIQPVKVPIMLF